MKSEDIARLAGVSRSTVSRVINGYCNVPEETRQKVLKIIEQYNYEPNTSARVLAGKATNTIGLFVISTADKDNPNRIYQNNYFAPLVDAVVDTANSMGYYVLVNTIYTEKDYAKIKQAYMQKRIDGGIIVGSQRDMGILPDISRSSYPFAILDYDAQDILTENIESSNLTIINSTDFEGTCNALEYLLQLGHRDIGILAGRMNTNSARQRFLAYQYMMKQNNLKINKDFILKGEFLKRNTYDEIIRLLRCGKLPTAIFSSNDDMALAAIEIFKKHGVRIPEDISIIGFDDIFIASQLKPALTTVRVPIHDMARKAVISLVDSIEKGSGKFRTYSFATELMIRETCAKPV